MVEDAAPDRRVAVIAVEHDPHAIEAHELVVRDREPLGALRRDRTLPLESPVAAAGHAVRVLPWGVGR